jgi:sugar porter (SP) family MFS transporter
MSSLPLHPPRPRVARRQHSALYVAAVAALGGLLFGYDTGVISGALLFVKQSFRLGPIGQSVVVSAVLVGAVVGAGAAMLVGDRIGRKVLIAASAVVFIAGTAIAAAATSTAVLIGGRVILGVAIGLSSSVVPVYIAEISPERRRGGFVALFQLAITVGIFLAYAVNYAFAPIHGWRWMFLCGVAPALVLLAGVLVLPRSPRWLALAGRDEEAREVLVAIGEEDVDKELAAIEASFEHAEAGWRELWAPLARNALLVGLGLGIFQQLIGINTVIYYAPTILQFSGFKSATVSILATMGVGAVNVAMTVVAVRLIDRVGRRPLLLGGLIPMALSLVAIGVAFDLRSGPVRWIAIASLIVYVGSFAVSWGWGFWLLNAELYPLEVRGRGTGLVVMVQWVANLAVSLTFLLLIHAVGKPATFWLYAALCAAAIVFTAFYVPETKGKTLEEIEAYWRSRALRGSKAASVLRPAEAPAGQREGSR